MAATREVHGTTAGERPDTGAGWVLFAAIVMIVSGFFAIIEGLGALLRHGAFYHSVANYPFGGSLTTWGWVILIAGGVVCLAGFAVLTGALWARMLGITLAGLSALANFFFLPYYPFWALTVITLDFFVIWALAAHGKALVAD